MYGQTMNNDATLAGGDKPLLAGRYNVVRRLGTGGMGSVWLAEDRQLDNKLFAVKMLPSILVSNKRAYRQLKDEALVAMRLVHPNIVQIRAFEENNGNPFLVMDYIEGQTLDDYLAAKGKLAEDETARLLKPIASALDHAHGECVVHRDVKPANIMIRKDGHPYILDFGIAREIQETMTRVTGKLSSGTLLYMSPEQLRGQPPKAAQDVYSFAAMAYECLKGEPPFSRGQIEFQILNELPEQLPDGIRMAAS
ncbi:MAG: serine/threonine protein kinase, partial [Kiritimatiellae bacterium]|nr:serine/threonine protein kinase [Kiritimatiellia bacterium]